MQINVQQTTYDNGILLVYYLQQKTRTMTNIMFNLNNNNKDIILYMRAKATEKN